MDDLAANKESRIAPEKPFNFEQWCAEIDQHPAFLKGEPTPGPDGQYSAAIEAIRVRQTTFSRIILHNSRPSNMTRMIRLSVHRPTKRKAIVISPQENFDGRPRHTPKVVLLESGFSTAEM
jgi:hypothetical protein